MNFRRAVLSLLLAVVLGIAVMDVGANSLSAGLSLSLTSTLTSNQGLALASAPFTENVVLTLANGTGASQADVVWASTRTLAASGTDTFDFAGGGLVDAFGGAIAPAKVKALFVYAYGANTNNAVVGGNANAVPIFGAATHTIAVKPGGVFLWIIPGTGVTVTAGTGDIIQVVNSAGGTSITYDIIVIGTSV